MESLAIIVAALFILGVISGPAAILIAKIKTKSLINRESYPQIIDPWFLASSSN